MKINDLKYKHSLWFIIIVTVLTSVVNLPNSIYAYELSHFNILATVVYLVAWCIFGVFNGASKNRRAVVFSVSYFGLAIACYLYSVLVINPIIPFLIFGILNISSLYGIIYFLKSNNYIYNMLMLMIPLIISVLGYTLGAINRKRFSNIQDN